MAKKVKVTFTVEKSVFTAFKKSLPEYVSVSGVLSVFVQESLNGFNQGRSLASTLDLLKSKVQTDLFEPVEVPRVIDSGRLPDGPTIL